MEERVQDGHWVVLESTDGKRVLGHVGRNSTARLGKRKRSIHALEGCRWGDVFALQADGNLERVEDEAESHEIADASEMGTIRDNRNLHDSDDNQALSQKAIESLKKSGVTGESLVRTVAQNSSTFQNKTAFSQDKYLKRKLRKYDLRLRVVKPTAFSICETYYGKSPEKTMCMRPDALGLLLGYSGVRAGCRALVYENCTGVVTSAVVERVGGFGQVLNIFIGSSPPGTEVLKMMNLSPEVGQSIIHVPLEVIRKRDVDENTDADYIRYKSANADAEPKENQKFATSERRLNALSRRPSRGAVKRMLRDGCDVLVVATRSDLVPVFDALLHALAPSGSFAVYSQYLQPLSELQYALQLSKMVTRCELMESTCVSHQILPGRTHPAMSDSATGGYVLWGVRTAVAPLV